MRKTGSETPGYDLRVRAAQLTILLLLCACQPSDTSTSTSSSAPPDASAATATPPYQEASKTEPGFSPRLYKFPKRFRWFTLPLNNPGWVEAEEANFLTEEDLVVGVVRGESARAYPWKMLTKYHVVNDYFRSGSGKNPTYDYFIVTLCEKCSGASVFEADLPDEEDYLTMGICGMPTKMLGTFAICDMQTGSWWHPFLGEAMGGPLSGTKLRRGTVFVEEWQDWSRRFPHTTVTYMTAEVKRRPHGADDTHPGSPGKFKTAPNPVLADTTLVFGLDTKDLAYAQETIEANNGIFHDEGRNTVLLSPGEYSVLAFDTRVGDESLTNLELVSRLPMRFRDASGTTWDSTGSAVSGPLKGSTLKTVPGYVTEWYEYSTNSPEAVVVSDKTVYWQPYSQKHLDGAKKRARPVVIDFWASWCPPCLEMEKLVFSDQRIVALSNQIDFIRVEASEESAELQRIKERFNVIALPAIVFIRPGGQIASELRLKSFEDADAFYERLQRFLGSESP